MLLIHFSNLRKLEYAHLIWSLRKLYNSKIFLCEVIGSVNHAYLPVSAHCCQFPRSVLPVSDHFCYFTINGTKY